MDRDDLEKLDDLRYSDPQRARELAEEALETAPAPLVPLALGVLGACHRQMGDLRSAASALKVGLALGRKRGDWWSLGRLTQKMGYVHGDRGKWGRAATAANEAVVYYLYVGDDDGVGRALVERSRACYYLGEFAEALEGTRRALELLAPNSHRFRFSAWVGAGLNYTSLGDLRAAMEACERAEEPARHVGPALLAKRLGLVAEIAELQGDYRRGELALVEAAEVYLRFSPADSALASVRAIEMILEQGELARAQDAVWPLARYLDSCRRMPVVTGAILELIKLRERLDLALARQTAEILEGEIETRTRTPGEGWIPRSEASSQPPGSG